MSHIIIIWAEQRSCSRWRESCQLQVLRLRFLAKFKYSSIAIALTCQSGFVLREHQEALVHLLGAWRKDAWRNVLRVRSKNLRCCRLGTFGWCCTYLRRWWLFRLRFEGKNCSRNGAWSTVDDFAIIDFNGVDRDNCVLFPTFKGFDDFHSAFHFKLGTSDRALHVNFLRL